MDEKITVTAEFSQTDVAAALMCLGEELTPERWEQVKAAFFLCLYIMSANICRAVLLSHHTDNMLYL